MADTPQQLLQGAQDGDAEQIRKILQAADRNVDVNCRDGARNTPSFIAAREGHADAVKVLLRAGAAVDAADRFGDTALLAASEHTGNTAIIEAIL
jgi:ankyrin repeat protein